MALVTDTFIKVVLNLVGTCKVTQADYGLQAVPQPNPPVDSPTPNPPVSSFDSGIRLEQPYLVGSSTCLAVLYQWHTGYPGTVWYSHWITKAYTVTYNFAAAMAQLTTMYPPSSHEIATIATGLTNSQLANSNVNYGDPTVQPKAVVVEGEGDKITITQTTLSTESYMKRIIDDMYHSRITTGQMTLTGEGPNINTSPSCTYDRTYVVPTTLLVTVYIAAKSDSLDFSTMIGGEWEGTPVDSTKINPAEKTDDSADSLSPGNNSVGVRDYGSSIGSSGNGAGLQVNPLIDFDYMYIPQNVDITNTDGVVVGEGIIAGSQQGHNLDNENVYVQSITQSVKSADTMSFIEHVKYDEAGIFNINDKVFGLVAGNTRFKGWIKSKQRVISDSEQYIQYEAVGVRGWLQTIPFASTYTANLKPISWIFNDISQYLPRMLVNERLNLSVLPTSLLPTFSLESATYAYALDAVLDYASIYQWYVDCHSNLNILDLNNLPVVNLSMPIEGEYLKNHPTYKIISKNLNVDVSSSRTRCIITGDFPIREYEERVDPVYDNRAIPTLGATIYLHKRIQPNLISNNSIPVYVYWTDPVFTGSFTYNLQFVDCNTGEIRISGGPLSRRPTYVRYCIKEDKNPLKYDTGWRGSAFTDYGVQQVLFQQDTRFRKITLPEGVIRDDTSLMVPYANNLLKPLEDWKVGGSITLDGLNVDCYIGKSVHILNSNCVELTTSNMAIMSVTWDFENKTTSLSLTNDYYLGTSIVDPVDDSKYDERKLVEKLILAKRKVEETPWVWK